MKKGTAKVTFIGEGNCSGTKTISFKIKERSLAIHWAKQLAELFGLQ